MNKSKRNKAIKNIFSSIAFVLVAMMCLHMGSLLLSPKRNNDQKGMISYITNGYYGEQKNTLDLLLIGNSDLYNGFIPIDLWQKHGITSYVSGKPNQNAKGAYNILRNALKYQNPKVVVLEADMFFETTPSKKSMPLKHQIKSTYKHLMKLYKDTFKNLDDGIGTAISYKFPLLKYHERWKDFRLSDISAMKNTYHYTGKGFILSTGVKPYNKGFSYMGDENAAPEVMSNKCVRQLEKIVKLCEKNNIELRLMNIPSASSWAYARHHTVADFADKKGLPYTDLNTENDGWGFDWTTDTKDGGNHLNIVGAQKVTEFYGDMLAKSPLLKDRSNDELCKRWHSDSDDFEAYRQESLKKIKSA